MSDCRRSKIIQSKKHFPTIAVENILLQSHNIFCKKVDFFGFRIKLTQAIYSLKTHQL